MRVGIIALMTETNTFASSKTTLADFEADVLLTGPAIRDLFQAAHHEVGGFFEGLDRHGIEAVPIFAARAFPSGIITTDAALALTRQLLGELSAAEPLDGLLVAPHGAAVAENERDFDGWWLTQVRLSFGKDRPIICTLDMHANVSQRMIDACNATIVYRSNPHKDQRQRGIEAANLMARTLRGEIKPTQAATFPPIAINIERQLTAMSPCRDVLILADEMRKWPDVLSNSVVLGFPYADVAEMGSSFITVTDNDPVLAQKLSNELANYVMQRRQLFTAEMISVEDAIDDAMRRTGPVCLLDMGDNMGGGAPADGTILASAILSKNAGPAFVCINDPEAQAKARAAGVGTELVLSIGGKSDLHHGPPLLAKVRVISLHDGTFEEPDPSHGGWTHFNMGPTTIVETAGGLTIQITSRRTLPVSLKQLTSCRVDPSRFQILVAKGVHAPVAVYQKVCASIIRVNTPGVTTADMTMLHYEHRRRPLFPLEQIGESCG